MFAKGIVMPVKPARTIKVTRMLWCRVGIMVRVRGKAKVMVRDTVRVTPGVSGGLRDANRFGRGKLVSTHLQISVVCLEYLFGFGVGYTRMLFANNER